jgi:hypothetical protein
MADPGPIVVREAPGADWPGIWPIIAEVARAGETFAMEAAPDEATARTDWTTPPPARVTVEELLALYPAGYGGVHIGDVEVV